MVYVKVPSGQYTIDSPILELRVKPIYSTPSGSVTTTLSPKEFIFVSLRVNFKLVELELSVSQALKHASLAVEPKKVITQSIIMTRDTPMEAAEMVIGNKLSITKNGIELKNGYDVILPLTDDNKIFIAYSENGKDGDWNIPDAVFDKAKVYNISAEGNEYLFDAAVKDKKISLDLKANQAVAIIAD